MGSWNPVGDTFRAIDEMTGGSQRKAANDARRASIQQNLMMQQLAESIRPASAPAIAPVLADPKAAADSMQSASADVQRQQLMRRGLMSTFTRFGNATTTAPSLAGKASKLGG